MPKDGQYRQDLLIPQKAYHGSLPMNDDLLATTRGVLGRAIDATLFALRVVEVYDIDEDPSLHVGHIPHTTEDFEETLKQLRAALNVGADRVNGHGSIVVPQTGDNGLVISDE